MGFFDKLSEKANGTIQTAKDKTSKISSEMSVKSQISDKNARLGILYNEIGKEVFVNSLKDVYEITDTIKEKLKEVSTVNSDINKLNAELLTIRGIKTCSACGAQIPVGSDFCPKCGKKITEVVESAPEAAKEAEVVNEEPKTEENNEENKEAQQ